MSTPYSVAPPRSWLDPESHYLKALDSEWYAALLVLQDRITSSTMKFWSARNVRNGHLPITTGSISSPMGLGSDSHPVAVRMFGIDTYLADSMQFGLEYLCRLSSCGAYYLMPSFRGEAPDETHLCQFFHSEAELPGTLERVMDVVEDYLRSLVADLAIHHRELLTRLTVGGLDHLDRLLCNPTPFRRLTFDEAVEVLDGDPALVAVDPNLGWRTLSRAGERELIHACGEFVWVTNWDPLAVPFYQAYDEHSGTARNADLLFGPGEVVGAGQRHCTEEDVVAALEAHGLPSDPYHWYAAMKQVLPMQTSGFGMGVERFLMWLLRNDDIRDFQLFIRENGRANKP